MKRLPPFSVILVFVVLTLVGAGMIPLLNIQYTPSKRGSEIGIEFYWNGASAKLVESEVTSKIEGLVASVSGVKEVSSVSQRGYGSVTVQLKDKDNLDIIRFEIASLIRQTYKKLPQGVSYPSMSVSSLGTNAQPILTFTINADLPTQQIENYTDEHIVKEISLVEGVNSVVLSGATPFYTEVAFDPQKLATYGISLGEFHSALVRTVSGKDIVGNLGQVGILLKSDTSPEHLEDVAVKKVDGRIIRVGDLAKIDYKEKEPSRYYRINGLNTINVTVYPEKFVNTLDVCAAVKSKMESLEAGFPDKFSVITSYDSSIDLKEEIDKIVLRTVLSLLILLVFVLAASRSIRYLFVITVSLLANILIAFVFYVLFDLEIHLYSMAGITVSLGIIIDTSIVMISHYGYYRNRKVFTAILGAQLTTIGALVVVFLLPEKQRVNLNDFSAVIIINLAISLLVSAFFIPALVDTMGVKDRESFSQLGNKRRIIRFDGVYAKYIAFARKFRWALILLAVLGFGLPISLLPEKLGSERKDYFEWTSSREEKGVPKEDNLAVRVYNRTIGSDFFKDKLKKPLDMVLGGSLRLFLENYSSLSFYREPTRPSLTISASLPDGCTIGQLNEIVLSMENFLSQFDEIEIFKTNIYSHSNAQIAVNFKKEYENSYFPLMLKQEVISKAIDFGGANWGVYGIDDQGFSNSLYTGYKSNRIVLTGYNYDQLYAFCQNSLEALSHNARVRGAEISGEVGWGNSISRSEYYIDYDPYLLSSDSLSLSDAFSALQEQLFITNVGSYYKDGIPTALQMVSQNKAYFDVWNLKNEYISIGSRQMKFADIGTISKRSSGNDIYKKNQQYSLIVAYDFVGPSQLSQKVMKREIERLNESVLPIGYKATSDSWNYGSSSSNNIWLLLLIIGIIYFICAVLFESLTYPLIIISLIPISFIGVFLIFSITGCNFDQGGYASLVMLCGIVVNAGIYILNEYDSQMRRRCGSYVRAYNHKIIPIMLTVLSTVLGLIPFLFDGPSEVFWFAFALGTMGGLLFSLVALVLFLPVWVRR